jgi:hypothetical protein
MDTNRHEGFAPKAFGALECGGPPEDGFAVANLTPLSGAKLARFARHLACFADHFISVLQA